MPPLIVEPKAPDTIKTEFEKEQDNELESTATVEQLMAPVRYSVGLDASGFHLGKNTRMKPPVGIEWIGLNLTSRLVEVPTT